MQTWHIHIEGQVQGVGFRPFVYLLAKKYHLSGWVNNTTDGVHIKFNATKTVATAFYKALLQQTPALAKITRHQKNLCEQTFFDNFQIIHSNLAGTANLLLTPDFAMCKDCYTEVTDENDRRFIYSFITCTNCGPRFSIIAQLPYDRERTTMQPFAMCPNCQAEYDAPLNRRYWSQTNSCSVCGIQLHLKAGLADTINQNLPTTDTAILQHVINFWKAGKIVAIKGIGGYLLTCAATNETAVQTLRERKQRPSKPFALMFPDVRTLEKVVQLNEQDIAALQSAVAPIVLVDRKEEMAALDLPTALHPNLNQMGVLLPYTPLFALLLKKFGQPIVATSGNRSNSPIVFEDTKVIENLGQIADYILGNNRSIVVPQDDSVIKYTTFKRQKIILRRSRGLAPTYIQADLVLPKQTIIATGAMLKSTFSLVHQKNSYISQYLGDLASFDTQESYRHTLQHVLNLFNTQPEVVLCDQHPEYPSTLLAQALAAKNEAVLQSVQHHIAHFSAILGEYNLLDTQEPILGVIWDGTGLGDDQQIWGGEFFRYENYDFLRRYHFDYFDFILGDKMPKEPRISALSACWDVMGMESFLRPQFTKTEWQIYTKLLNKENPLKTSSVGRVFDAVAALLNIKGKQTYEGEAAMELETLANQYFKEHGLGFSSSYFMEGAHYYRIPTKSLMTNIIMDLQKGKASTFIAAKFHFSLVQLVKIVANNLNIHKLAFSGGVFQNGVLVDLLIHHLGQNFDLYFHKELSPNDENISFGQLINFSINERKITR